MHHRNCRPRRALVYKGFSENAGLDETNQTKAIILPKPFVLKNRQRDFFYQKALISDEHVSLMWIFVHLGAFLPSNRFLFLPWQGSEQTKKNKKNCPSETANLCTQQFLLVYEVFHADFCLSRISRNIHHYRSYVPSFRRKHSAEPTAASLQRGSLRVIREIRVRQKNVYKD